MDTTVEPFNIGLSPEKEKQFEVWLSSPEGQRTITEMLTDIQKIIAEMRKAHEVPSHLLHVPMDI
jgi:hypothetical protein